MPRKKIGKKGFGSNRGKSKNLLLFFVVAISFLSVFVTVNQLQKPQTITQHADTITTAVKKPIWGCIGLGSSDICTSANDGNNFTLDPDAKDCLVVKGTVKPEQVEQGQVLNFEFEISVKETAPVNNTASNCNRGFPLSQLSIKATNTKSKKSFIVDEKSTPTTLLTNSVKFTAKHTIGKDEELGEWTATLNTPTNNDLVKFPNSPDLKFTVVEPCKTGLEVTKKISVDKSHYNVGETARATITYRNTCKTDFNVSDILIYLIKPGTGDTTTTDTFGTRSGKVPYTFKPQGQQGDTYTVDATMTIPESPCGIEKPTCSWAARGAYVKPDGSVVQETNQVEFTVGAQDPVDKNKALPEVPAGGTCDPSGKTNKCASGYVCPQKADQGGKNVCVKQTPAGGVCDPKEGNQCVSDYACKADSSSATGYKCVKDSPPPAGKTPAKLSQQIVYFDFNSNAIKSDYTSDLAKVVTYMKANPTAKVTLEGHTDNVGAEAYNKNLGMQRAVAVRTYLVGKGIAANRFTVVSKGESEPLETNKTALGRYRNRRVEIFTP